jgi:hypothetical protein
MTGARSKIVGLRTGLIILAIISAIALILIWRPGSLSKVEPTQASIQAGSLNEALNDAATQAYLTRLQTVSPGTATTLDAEATAMIANGKETEALAELVLRSILTELKRGAFEFKQAPTEHYDKLIAHSATALTRLRRENSTWCNGPRIAEFLELNEDALIPDLLARYPYGSESYNWAMRFGELYLDAVQAAREAPVRRPGPSAFDKRWLQQTGLALGSNDWTLGLQIAAFSQAEGQGYAQMQEAISGIDVCELGLAAAQVSGSLPEQVRGTIWGDLLPELFHGNTPYVLWRVNDYFFLD